MTDTPRPGQSGAQRWADDGRRFRLDSRIATGGMGEVWRATDTVLGREVAVKLLKVEYADDATFRSRFETEARHAAALHHPGVASIYDFGESAAAGAADGSGAARPFLVMELVEGRPLSALLDEAKTAGRPLDAEVVRDLMAQTGDALGAAHRAGIVHRDVKPANLMVTPDRVVKVTDFGIARAADGVGITRTGAVMGTPQYLSPEQAEGRPATAASDVYALGVVTFECLAGHRPFEADSPVATALAHIRQPVPDLPARIPADLASVVRRAMAKDPAERFADGTAYAAALRSPATAAVPRPTVVPVPAPVPVAEPATQVLRPTPAPPVTTTTTTTTAGDDRRSPWPVVVAIVVVLVALAVVITLLATRGGNDSATNADNSTRRPRQSRTEPSTPATTTTTATTTQVNEGDYVSHPYVDVSRELRDLGFKVQGEPQDNSNPDLDGQVTGVDPNGDVEQGQTLTVTYWADAPQPSSSAPPTTPSTPTSSAAPSTPSSPSSSTSSSTSSPAAAPVPPSPPGGSAAPGLDAATPDAGGPS